MSGYDDGLSLDVLERRRLTGRHVRADRPLRDDLRGSPVDAHPGMPIDSSLLRPDLWVAELIYFPIETELLRKARAIGCRTINGAGMAIHQAAAAFRLFTGLEPDSNRMAVTFSRLGEDR